MMRILYCWITMFLILLLIRFFKRLRTKKPRVNRLEDVNDWKSFEVFLFGLLPTKWYTDVKLNGKTNDKWIDLFARKDWKLWWFQAKYYSGSIGSPTIRNLVGSGKLYKCDVVCLCYTGKLTKEARLQAKSLWVIVWEYHK